MPQQFDMASEERADQQDGQHYDQRGPYIYRERGLDSMLAKTAPPAEKLTAATYRPYRKKLDIFHRQVRRKGKEALLDGAY